MGFTKKSQLDGGLESDGRKWVIAGISVRSSLKQINTKPRGKDSSGEGEDGEESCSTTPTGKEARIPERLPCPPAPRKRRPASRCNNHFNREFFTPPDLETVFIRRQVEKAN